MTAKRLLRTAALTLAVAVAAPAAAQAGAGPGDDVAGAITPPGDVLPLSTVSDPHILGYEVDTSAYTTESGEPSQCPQRGYTSTYGKTVWGAFKAPQYGRLDATAAGFDSVIALFDASADGAGVACTDRLASKIEAFRRDELPTVKKNHVYLVQVGGAQQADGSIAGGPLSVDLELIRPEVTTGDAVLTWVSTGGGVKVKSLKVTGPSGSQIVASCVRKKCGKGVGLSVSKPVFRQKIQALSLAHRPAVPAAAPENKGIDDIPVTAAASKNIFKGRKIKNGGTLFVAVQREDEIGVIYFWNVKRNSAGTKNVGCIEPNSTKIRRVGTCTGR
jgi:hypothetical protein